MPVLLFILVLVTQDASARVRELIEKLESPELAVREEGARGLVKMGPPALPELNKRFNAADASVKAQLKAVIRKIECDARIAAVLEPPKPVTLKSKDSSSADVFGELGRQTGFRFHYDRLDNDLKLKLDVAGAEPWVALDALCRQNRLSWGAWSSDKPGEILVTKNDEWTERTRFKSGGLTVELWALNCSHLELFWNIYHGPAPTFQLVRFEVDEIRDSGGKDFGVKMTPETWKRLWSHGPPPQPPKAPGDVRVSTVTWYSEDEMRPEIERLSRLKGRLILETTFAADPPDRHEITIPIDLKDVVLH